MPVGVPICVEPICCGAVRLPVVVSLPLDVSSPALWLLVALLWFELIATLVNMLSPCMMYGIHDKSVPI